MSEPPGALGGSHPSPEALDRCADDLCDRERDAELLAHVATCATCRETVERLRRVTAGLSLASAPPPDLRARVAARRTAGERVVLPTPGAPFAPSPAERRPNGRARRHGLRWTAAGTLGIAAALTFLVVRRAPVPAVPTISDATSGPIAAPVPARPAAPDRPAPAPVPVPVPVTVPDQPRSAPTPAAPSGEPSGRAAERPAYAATREMPRAVSVTLAGGPADVLAPTQADALEAVRRAAAAGAARRVVVRYTDPMFTRESDSWALAQRVADHLALREVDPARVRLVRVAAIAGAPAGAVEVLVVTVPE